MSGIRVIATGGTIDADAYENKPPERSQFSNNSSRALEFIKSLDDSIVIDQWLQKDSKDISQKDLEILAEKINLADENFIIVTHGTDTIINNAKFVHKLVNSYKTIFFVGAMWPLANGQKSDGEMNLKYALDNIISCESGVYIVGKNSNNMAEKFLPDLVYKDFENLVFVRIN